MALYADVFITLDAIHFHQVWLARALQKFGTGTEIAVYSSRGKAMSSSLTKTVT